MSGKKSSIAWPTKLEHFELRVTNPAEYYISVNYSPHYHTVNRKNLQSTFII